MACDDEIVPLQERIETVADDADLNHTLYHSYAPLCLFQQNVKGVVYPYPFSPVHRLSFLGPFKLSPTVFPDPVIANATIDRIFDRAEVCLFKGRSYRLEGKIEVKNIDLKVNTK